jgi:hypothetical protein
LHPVEEGRGDWRQYGGSVLRLDEEGLDLLQIGAQQVDQETRQVMANRIEKRGELGLTGDGKIGRRWSRYWNFSGEKFL